MSGILPAAWRAWGAEPCTRQVLETMRAAVKLRRRQSEAAVAAGQMLAAAEAEAEAKAIEDLVAAIDSLTGAPRAAVAA
jgi:hypothetical protein